MLAWGLGILSFDFFVAFLVVAFLLGLLLSAAALALEEFSFRRHPSGREIARMLLYAGVENFGYRQLTDAWRAIAVADLARRRKAWGAQNRKGFAPPNDGVSIVAE